MEVIWKLCASIMHNSLRSAIILHGALHGVRQIRGIGTATMEANMDHQLTGLCHEPLFQVFLDVRKAYDSLDIGR